MSRIFPRLLVGYLNNSMMFMADAKSMYINIDTEHALWVLWKFLEDIFEEGKLPLDFDINMLVQAATFIMCWNLFKYGDCFLSN